MTDSDVRATLVLALDSILQGTGSVWADEILDALTDTGLISKTADNDHVLTVAGFAVLYKNT